MASSERSARACLLVALALAASTAAAAPVGGYAVERFAPAPAGSGWLMLDDLEMSDGLGGALALTTDDARDPLRVSAPGTPALAVVSDEAIADVGMAASFDRYRLTLDLPSPLLLRGQSGQVGGEDFQAPRVDPAANPDSLLDARVGVQARVFGKPGTSLRLGVGAQLFVPSGARADYVTDGTWRGALQALAAGDAGRLAYAAQVSFHLRPLNDFPIPGSPRGPELLFGLAGGYRLPWGAGTVVIGPELFGETALSSLLGAGTTGLEALLEARYESPPTSARRPRLRVKLGAGAGLEPAFGAPQWRVVLSLELLGTAQRAE